MDRVVLTKILAWAEKHFQDMLTAAVDGPGHGTAGPGTVEKVMSNDLSEIKAYFDDAAPKNEHEWTESLHLPPTNKMIGRALRLLAFAAAVIELINRWGITPAPEGLLTHQIKRCFESWLLTRDESDVLSGAVGLNTDVAAGVMQVLSWIQENPDQLISINTRHG